MKKDTNVFLLAGLGNPGDAYAHNRHNIGFMAIDGIAEEYSFKNFRKKFQGEMSEGEIGGYKVILLKPMTYMNNSGQSVKAAAAFYKVPPSRVIVLHDELDLPPAALRVKVGGGLAGHNGLKSIKAHLGTADFVRLRFGIGHPGDKGSVSDYVLSNFSKADMTGWVETLCHSVAKECGALLDGRDKEFIARILPEQK